MTLAAQNLACFRGDRLVLRELSFSLPRGTALLLTGPNGAGKSTTLRLLAGLRRPDAGRVAWDGSDIADDPAAHAGRLVFVGEGNAVKPALTAAENLRFAARRAGGSASGALEAMGLSHLADVPARLLSAGQRRRLALSRLALGPAPVWLLDEPTLGLDAASVGRLGALMERHLAAGGVLVAATHLPLPLGAAATLAL